MALTFTDAAGEDPASPRYRALRALLASGPLSRAQLARAIGLAPSTITALVRSLVDEGVLIGAGPASLADARRSGPRGVALALNPALLATVGVDFGFRHVRAMVCDLNATVLAVEQADLPTAYNSSEGIASAARLVKEAITAAGVERHSVLGAGVALPGPIDINSQRVVDTDILPGWGGTVAGDFARAFSLPVLLENDANLAALGEHIWGAGRGYATTITVKFHSGIGAGLIVSGELASGTHGGAGEIGHITIDPRGPLCRCGKRGCLDTFASVPAILDAMAAKHPGLAVAELIGMLGRDDPGARRVVGDAAALVGQVVGSASMLIAPDRVIVVGAMARAGNAVVTPLSDAIQRQALPGVPAPDVIRGSLGDRHTALGATALVLRHSGWLVTTRG
jgi:predicted NBD/HSP70 family sugar kinase/DNA-binding transcriptional ArsR family regulator